MLVADDRSLTLRTRREMEDDDGLQLEENACDTDDSLQLESNASSEEFLLLEANDAEEEE